MKIKITPGTFIGDGGDSRVTRQLHLGSSTDVFNQIAAVTSNRLALAQDYGSYTMNYQRNSVKRYYKVAAYEKRLNRQVWLDTTTENYSDANTYMKWEIAGVN